MLTESHDEEQIIARVAALDSGKAEVVCCVRVPAGTNAKKRLQEGPQTPLGGTVEHLDPNSLQLGDNVREYPNLNQAVPRQHRRTRCPFAYYRDSPPRRHRGGPQRAAAHRRWNVRCRI